VSLLALCLDFHSWGPLINQRESLNSENKVLDAILEHKFSDINKASTVKAKYIRPRPNTLKAKAIR